MRVLVTGGVRSGKSAHAEQLLEAASEVVYVAAGSTVLEEPDPDWAARIRAHQERRPAHWHTVETRDLATALRAAGCPVLVDCLGTWLTALLDENDGWERSSDELLALVEDRVREVVDGLRELDEVVVVTNEVGLGVVPEHRSGRLFRDLLGLVNQRVAAACDEVHLVIAGRVLVL